MADEMRVVELWIPSELGYEKMAMKLAAAVAQQMGFPPERVEDLETAVSEACLNAMDGKGPMNTTNLNWPPKIATPSQTARV